MDGTMVVPGSAERNGVLKCKRAVQNANVRDRGARTYSAIAAPSDSVPARWTATKHSRRSLPNEKVCAHLTLSLDRDRVARLEKVSVREFLADGF